MMPAAVIHQDAMNEIVLLKARIRELEGQLRAKVDEILAARTANASPSAKAGEPSV